MRRVYDEVEEERKKANPIVDKEGQRKFLWHDYITEHLISNVCFL